MALADYRLCDVCGGKAFYDANLDYRWADTDDLDDWGNKIEEDDFVRGRGYILDYLGDWAVVCTECAKTHRVVVESIKGSKKADTKTEKAITALHQALAEANQKPVTLTEYCKKPYAYVDAVDRSIVYVAPARKLWLKEREDKEWREFHSKHQYDTPLYTQDCNHEQPNC